FPFSVSSPDAIHSLDQVPPFANAADLTIEFTPISSLDTTNAIDPDNNGDYSSVYMNPGGDYDPSSESMDTDNNNYSSTKSMDSDTDEDGDSRSLPNVTNTLCLERAEDHCSIYPKSASIASDTGNNTGSFSSAGITSSQDHQLPVPDPNTWKPATNLNGARATKSKSSPAETTQSESTVTAKPAETIEPKPARKADTKRPRIFKCQFPGCTKAYTTKYSLTSHANSQHDDIGYRCLFCETVFSRYGDCTRHEDTLHRMKRWKCKRCEKAYTRNPDAKQQHGCVNGRRHSFKIVIPIPFPEPFIEST
ncbi:MAG: hypothetical protein JOS17DRAFT_422628, partial [Linnemannia elongata]